jgi:hypothetical protein
MIMIKAHSKQGNEGEELVLHVECSTIIHAPQPQVIATYRDYCQWPRIFPTIRAVRATRVEAGRQTLAIDHREGPVVNILADVAPDEIELKEWKRRYTATFRNRFQPIPEGTRYTLQADLHLKGAYRLLTPFIRGYVRRQMERLVLQPMKKVMENQGDTPEPGTGAA